MMTDNEIEFCSSVVVITSRQLATITEVFATSDVAHRRHSGAKTWAYNVRKHYENIFDNIWLLLFLLCWKFSPAFWHNAKWFCIIAQWIDMTVQHALPQIAQTESNWHIVYKQAIWPVRASFGWFGSIHCRLAQHKSMAIKI